MADMRSHLVRRRLRTHLLLIPIQGAPSVVWIRFNDGPRECINGQCDYVEPDSERRPLWPVAMISL